MMNNEEKNTPDTNVMVQSAANYGLWFGLYLMCLFLVFANGGGGAMLSLLGMIMILCAPLMVLRMLRASYQRDRQSLNYFRLWNMSVMIFAFASLICALGTFVWMQFVHPGFIYDKAQEALELYRSMPEFQNSDIVIVLQKAIENGDLPTPIQFVVEMGWTTVMLGSIVSVPLALLARIGGKKDVE
ncbi:MAG: DUF4199 domain-containing protein [Bacteroidales bacterium]|nr:DUF4199 domain-containing protein [Bacteroidales bacterium]